MATRKTNSVVAQILQLEAIALSPSRAWVNLNSSSRPFSCPGLVRRETSGPRLGVVSRSKADLQPYIQSVLKLTNRSSFVEQSMSPRGNCSACPSNLFTCLNTISLAPSTTQLPSTPGASPPEKKRPGFPLQLRAWRVLPTRRARAWECLLPDREGPPGKRADSRLSAIGFSPIPDR